MAPFRAMMKPWIDLSCGHGVESLWSTGTQWQFLFHGSVVVEELEALLV